MDVVDAVHPGIPELFAQVQDGVRTGLEDGIKFDRDRSAKKPELEARNIVRLAPA